MDGKTWHMDGPMMMDEKHNQRKSQEVDQHQPTTQLGNPGSWLYKWG